MGDRSDIDGEEEETGSSYWVLRFPFDIHGGWIMAAALVNTNVVLVALGCSSKEQAIAGSFVGRCGPRRIVLRRHQKEEEGGIRKLLREFQGRCSARPGLGVVRDLEGIVQSETAHRGHVRRNHNRSNQEGVGSCRYRFALRGVVRGTHASKIAHVHILV